MAGEELKAPGRADKESLEQQLELVVPADRALAAKVNENACLFLVGQSGRARMFPLQGQEAIIGRAAEAHVCLDVPAVSNMNTRLFVRDGGWWIEDLGSTNGTFLNGNRVSLPTPLIPGSSIVVGDARLLFLAAGMTQEQTVFLAPNPTTDHLGSGSITTTTSSSSQTLGPYNAVPEEDPIAAAFRVMRLARAYIAHYFWLLTLLTCLGAAAGVLHARLSPPAGLAWFELTLKEEAAVNPVEEKSLRTRAFFDSAQSVFTSLPLIRKTLEELGMPSDDAAAIGVQGRLYFDREGRNSSTWRGEYTARTPQEAATLLDTHLHNFLSTEIEKALQVFRTQTEFLANQLNDAASAKREAEANFVAFRESHPDVIPGERVTPSAAPSRASSSRAAVRVSTTASQLAAAKERLAALDPYAAQRLAEINRRESALAAAEAKLTEARNRGLGERHPEVRSLQADVTLAKQQLAEARNATTSQEEKQASPDYQRLQGEVQRLQQEAQAVRESAARVSSQIEKKEAKTPKRSLPQLEAEYQEVASKLDSAQQLHTTLSQKLKASQLQLELERATAEAHYDVISPPTPVIESMVRVTTVRALLGGALGVFLTLLIVAGLEIRRLAARYAA